MEMLGIQEGSSGCSFDVYFGVQTPKTSMILSKSCIYGIQATIFVAAQGGGGHVPISRIAEQLDISFHFLTKVLQQLTSAGILESMRGPRGGVVLARPVAEIALFDLVSAIDGTDIFTECMLGLPGCGFAAPCPAHDLWLEVRNKFTHVAKSVTIQALAERSAELHVRLTGSLREFLPSTS